MMPETTAAGPWRWRVPASRTGPARSLLMSLEFLLGEGQEQLLEKVLPLPNPYPP